MESLMESLIEAVRMQPCLWNPLDTDYRDSVLKDAAWESVVEVINNTSIPNVKLAKTEWKRLRDNHRDALKRAKLGKNKLLPAQITTWKYAKAMQFLEPYMKYRITENIEAGPCNSKRVSNSDHDVSTTGPTEREFPSTNKRLRLNTAPVYNNVHPKPTEQVDSLDAFFNCIRQSTREMPQWLQTNVKKKIFAVIIEAEELIANQGQPSSYKPTPCNDEASHVDMEIAIKREVETEDEEEYTH